MWERKNIKNNARIVIAKNYWTAIVICFFIALITGEFGTSIFSFWNSKESIDPNYIEHEKMIKEKIQETTKIEPPDPNVKDVVDKTQIKIYEAIEKNINSATKSQKYVFRIWDAVALFNKQEIRDALILSAGALLSLLFTILIADPLIVGGKKYFLKARTEENANISTIIEVFKKEDWANIATIMFCRNIFNALWYLTIIGGVIKTYEYRMIPYILAENPNMKRKDAFKISKQMMDGNKWRTFVLDLSFFGWYFLSVLTFGILSILYVNPYNSATFAELYIELKEKVSTKDLHYVEN